MKNIFLKWIIFWIGFISTILVFIVWYAAWTNIATKSDGQTINAIAWNELVNNINTLWAKVDLMWTWSIWVGQTRQDVTASRALWTTYTNNTGKPIIVIVSNGFSWANSNHQLYVDGIIVSRSNEDSSTDVSLTAIVPAGSTYKYVCSWWNLQLWTELR